MSEQDEARSTGKGWCVFLVFLALAAVGCVAAITLWPDLLSLGTGRIVDRVAIKPQEAVTAGAQWRVVSQWQASGEMNEAENIYLVEFKDVPGWEAPAPAVLAKGRTGDDVEGVYIPARYSEETILTCCGSSTLSGRLGPELARLYLKHIGADEVRVVPGAVADNVSVQGIFYATREIRTVEISGEGTPAGFMALKDGGCDVAMATHRLSPVDIRTFGEGVITGESENRIGMDAVSVVVHRDNPVKSLSVEDVGGIFAGEITNWDQVGGPSAPIRLFALSEDFGTRRFFESVFLGRRPLAPSARVVDAHSLLSEQVAQELWGIGFCSITLAGKSREMAITASEGSEAVLPSAEAIRSLAYPASRSVYLYYRADSRNVYARDFVRLSLSNAGQSLVEKYGFLNLADISGSAAADEHVSKADQASGASIFRPGAPSVLKAPAISGPLPPLVQLDGEVVTEKMRKSVLQEYLDAIYGAERLPYVFRFQPSSLDLDRQAVQDVERVAAMMKKPANAAKAVILVGFSDSVGAYESNLAVARRRAEAVAEKLQEKGVRNVIVLAAGEEAAVEPNESRIGRERNRRVEIWLK
jgi:phosphate transport system substrate-binding protein